MTYRLWACERYLRDLARLRREGKEDTPEWERVADEADALWRQMTEGEQNAARVMAAELARAEDAQTEETGPRGVLDQRG